MTNIEPTAELKDFVRTFARMIAGLGEEAEAISWYEQRITVEKNKAAKAIMQDAQKEEFMHFYMDLVFLFRQKKDCNMLAQNILFKTGDIVDNAEAVEKKIGG